jgi:hypothetical protein
MQDDEAGQATPKGEGEATPEEAFLASLPPELRPVAKRWGAELFEFCNTTGLIGGGLHALQGTFGLALQTIQGAPSKRPIAETVDRSAAREFAILEQLINTIAVQLAEAKGWPIADIRECQQDITRAVQLTSLGDQPSKLILPH